MKDYGILLIDGDHHSLREMSSFLEEKGYQVTRVASGEDAIERLSKEHFDLVITEFHMHPIDGLTVLKNAKKINPETMVMMLTTDDDVTLTIDALRQGADDYLFKPLTKAELLRGVTHCLEKLGLMRKNGQRESKIDPLNEPILNMLKIMSHDIRGSLLSMLANLKLLSRGYYGKMDDGVLDNLKGLLSKTTRLIGTTEEYLGRTFSIDDDLEIEEEVLDLKHDIIDPVLDELSLEIKDHDIQIHIGSRGIPNHSIPIKVSKIWLKAVLRNLLKNAIKYGDERGPIAIGFEDCSSFYRLNVYNSGKPIPEENRDKLFTKFGRIENGPNGNGRTNGMGLGLYLIKKIIQKHGGEIWYEAKEQGSNFVLAIPARA
jgi:two-component system sensor histidine kinase/response regulator